jgi:hypothetical protein
MLHDQDIAARGPVTSPAKVMATPSATRIREAQLTDYEAIAALLSRNGIKPRSREEWEHFWVHNPVYRKMNGWAIGWVAENSERGVLGYVGNIPLSFVFKGREVITNCGHSLAVDADRRGSAASLQRRALNYRMSEMATATTANPNSYRFFEAGRMLRVPAGIWDRAAFWVTDYRGFLASGLSKRGWPKVLASPGAAVLSLKDKIAGRNSWMGQRQEGVQPASSFDERFDEFWGELQRTYPECFLANRSREVLQWHFKYALARNKAWIVTATNGPRLTAYAVFCRRDVAEHSLQRLQLVDYQALNDDPQPLVSMLAWGIDHCRKEGLHVLEAFGFRPEKQTIIDKLAPYHRQLPSWWYYYKPVNKALGLELQTPAVWDPSHYDGDTSL